MSKTSNQADCSYDSFSVSSIASHSMRAHSTTGVAKESCGWVIRITVTTKSAMRQRRKAQECCTSVMIVMGRVADSKILNELDGGVLCKASALHPQQNPMDDAPLQDPLESASL